MIVYLHGFNSSPLSGKGRVLAAYCAERKISFIAPALHHRPLRAKAEIESLLKSGARVLVGSSLGGYYATWFCENHPKVRAVLINPAVRVADKLAEFVGAEQRNFHTGDSYQFTESHLAELRTMEIGQADLHGANSLAGANGRRNAGLSGSRRVLQRRGANY